VKSRHGAAETSPDHCYRQIIRGHTQFRSMQPHRPVSSTRASRRYNTACCRARLCAYCSSQLKLGRYPVVRAPTLISIKFNARA
jgi:hypothetical protein